MMRAGIVVAIARVAIAIGVFACGAERASDEGAAKDNRPAMTEAYRIDVGTVCDAEKRSGAPAGDASLGHFLDEAVTSDGGRRLLRAIVASEGADKAKLLRAEGKRAGLDACPFADSLAARVQARRK